MVIADYPGEEVDKCHRFDQNIIIYKEEVRLK
jgi:hypothetical protein